MPEADVPSWWLGIAFSLNQVDLQNGYKQVLIASCSVLAPRVTPFSDVEA